MTRWVPIAAILVSAAASAQDVRDLVLEGNRHYRAGDFSQALDAYDRAEKVDATAPEVHFNQGAALYQLGDCQTAVESFKEAALLNEKAELDSRCEYNLGNCAVKQAEAQQEAAPQEALPLLQEGAEHYRTALEADPDMRAAAHNLELTRQQIRAIEEFLEQQPPQQDQQQGENEGEQEKEGEQQQEQQQDSEGDKQQQDQQQAQDGEGEEEPPPPQPAEEEQTEGEEERPPPNETARQILEEEQEREQQQVPVGGYRKVERDW